MGGQASSPSAPAAPAAATAATGSPTAPVSVSAGSKVLGMEITPELAEEYAGTEELLKYRAVFPPHCHKAFDAVRLCMMQKLDHDTCTEVYQAFRPCAKEMAQRKVMNSRAVLDEERRKKLKQAQQAQKQQQSS